MSDKKYVTDTNGFLKNVTVKVPAREVKLTRSELGNFVHGDLVPLLLCLDETPRTSREIRRMMYTLRLHNNVFGEPDDQLVVRFLLQLVEMGFVVRSKEPGRQYRYRRKNHADVTERGENAL